jgi:hypothetical protein
MPLQQLVHLLTVEALCAERVEVNACKRCNVALNVVPDECSDCVGRCKCLRVLGNGYASKRLQPLKAEEGIVTANIKLCILGLLLQCSCQLL